MCWAHWSYFFLGGRCIKLLANLEKTCLDRVEIFKNYVIFNCVCVSTSVCLCLSVYVRMCMWSPTAGFTGCFEPPDVRAKYQTPVFYKSSKCSFLLTSVSSSPELSLFIHKHSSVHLELFKFLSEKFYMYKSSIICYIYTLLVSLSYSTLCSQKVACFLPRNSLDLRMKAWVLSVYCILSFT